MSTLVLREAARRAVATLASASTSAPCTTTTIATTTTRRHACVGATGRRPFSTADAPRPAPAAPPAPDVAVPPLAQLLGYAGAVPFLALTPQVAPLLPAPLADAAPALHVGYGAAIASFLGGVHWGAAAAGAAWSPAAAARLAASPTAARGVAAARYVWSVAPCLAAWPAVALAPPAGAAVGAATLLAAAAVDGAFAARGLLPAWFPALRWPLTACAVIGLGARAVVGDGGGAEA